MPAGGDWLWRPSDAASLVAFRFLFGVTMAAAMVRLLANHWVTPLFTAPAFHFAYDGFGWVRPWPGIGMHIHVAALAVAALGLAIGRAPRACALIFFAGFTYLELVDKALYLNHYYLVSLLAGMLVVLPTPRAGQTLPSWVLWSLRAQVGTVYLYAGLAKVNGDWLLRAQPMRTWLAARADLPVIGPWLEEAWLAYAASWAGAVFDLAIVPLLLWRRSRGPAFVGLVLFHLATRALFAIGMFPVLMTVAATLFLAPEWPRRLGLFGPARTRRATALVAARARFVLIGAHLLVQAALPLRGLLWPGPRAWTGAGFNFAWNVMVAEKSGAVTFLAENPRTGRTTPVLPSHYLSAQQEAAMAQDPAMIAALARQIAKDLQTPDGAPVRVFADARAALNGRPAQRLIDPTCDLATEPPRVLPLR